MLGTWEIILIALVILLIFGGKKIPELMKGIGKGMRSFREGVEGKEDTENNEEKVKNKGGHSSYFHFLLLYQEPYSLGNFLKPKTRRYALFQNQGKDHSLP